MAKDYTIKKTDADWEKELSPDEFHIMREKGTEAPFSGKYNDFKDGGIFMCAACNNDLFPSNTKFDSGSGWPSFYSPVSEDSVEESADNSIMMRRTEVLCSRCGAHLGHVFDDGPKPTGKRYCINSIALKHKPK